MIPPDRRRAIVTGEEPIDRVLEKLPEETREAILLGSAWLVPWQKDWTRALDAIHRGLSSAVRDRAVFADLPDEWTFLKDWCSTMEAPMSTAYASLERLCGHGLAERRTITGSPRLQYRRARGYRAR